MIQLPTHINPPDAVIVKLKQYQSQITGTFEEKRAKAKSAFSSRNKKGNPIFDQVKAKLADMCSGAKRCAYCEDAPADEVEHIYPKDLYPDRCFDWNNYLYACGPCNGPKNNKFAVLKAGTSELVHLDGRDEPPAGTTVLINPREENGMDYCRLNFVTFHFEIIAAEGTLEYLRADYTFNEVLRLNTDREYLRKARENAYGMYSARLSRYATNKGNVPQAQLDKMIEQLQKEAHPSVWKEMQRSYKEGRLRFLDDNLYELFTQVPESLDW